MDWELIKVIVTTTGPMGLLSYGMFLHHSKVTQAMGDARAADAKSHAEARAADAKVHADRLAELIGDRKSERDLLITVVRENSAAVTALTAKIETDLGFHHRRASDEAADAAKRLRD